MAKSDKNDVPLVNMPRMGRRNAVAYPSRILNDDGAFSPINLLERSSVSDIDPQGMIAQELRLERRSQLQYDQKSKGTIPAAQVPSVLDGWKKLHDAKSNSINGIERLFEPAVSSTVDFPVVDIRARGNDHRNPGETADQIDRIVDHRGNPVIPWKKQGAKQTTVGEERRKLFESFDMTSVEPPETPQVSELTLRKMARKNRRKKKDGKDLRSQESEGSTLPGKLKDKDNKAPFSNVSPKVNTRWDKDKVENMVQQHATKNQNSPDPINKDKGATAGPSVNESQIEKQSTSNRTKNNGVKPLVALPVKPQLSKMEKLVTNYPASETVKNMTDKLPLTIAPRYNAKKVLGLTLTSEPRGPKNDARGVGDVSSRLYGVIPAHQKPKIDEQHGRQGPAANSLKSTFLNLQRINNAGAPPNKRASSTGPLVISRQSASILGTPAIGVSKKPAPIVTTIQPPPSPFLTSKISVQSQMNEIPINGEKIGARAPGTSRGAKKDPKDVAKPAKIQNRHKTTGNNAATKNKPATPPKITQTPAKVVPTLGPLPNKYNNIYIGPYSGSDSDGEQKSSTKKR